MCGQTLGIRIWSVDQKYLKLKISFGRSVQLLDNLFQLIEMH